MTLFQFSFNISSYYILNLATFIVHTVKHTFQNEYLLNFEKLFEKKNVILFHFFY